MGFMAGMAAEEEAPRSKADIIALLRAEEIKGAKDLTEVIGVVGGGLFGLGKFLKGRLAKSKSER